MALTYDNYPLVLAVLEQISQGRTMTAACNLVRLSVSTFKRMTTDDRQLAEMLMEAEQIGNDALADALLDPQAHVMYGSTDPKVMKIYSDNIKWLLAHRDKKRFGDSVEIKHEHTIAFAITDALEQAAGRVAMRQIEGTSYRAIETEADENERILAELMR